MGKTSQVAIVTGASGGIGQAVAVRLAKDGFFTLIHYNKNQVGAQETLELVEQAGGEGRLIQFDVIDSYAGEEVLNQFFRDHDDKKLAVLVNNAGIHKDMLAGLMSDEVFREVIETNLVGAFFLLRWCSKKMLLAKRGSIINMSSLAGQAGNPGQINYAASKAGLLAMTKTLAMELGAKGIRVNAVAPGLIETKMLEGLGRIDQMKKQIPMRRLGTPEEVANAVSFLASEQASYITGQTLSVNGGLYPT